MKRILPLLLVGLVLVSSAFADEWKHDYPVSGKPEVRLSTGDGSVEFMVWDRKQVSVSVYTEGWQIGSDGIRIEERQLGDRVEVTLHIPGGNWCLFCSRSIHVDVSLPRDANIDVHTGDGSIRGSRVHGNLILNTGDGSIHVEDVDGTVSARSGDGGIHVDGRFDALKIDTGDGSIHAGVDRGSKMTGAWYLHSGDGSIEMLLPADLSANLDVRTGDGSIRSDLPLSESDRSHHSLRGRLNGGGPLLELRSGDGSIHLRKD